MTTQNEQFLQRRARAMEHTLRVCDAAFEILHRDLDTAHSIACAFAFDAARLFISLGREDLVDELANSRV